MRKPCVHKINTEWCSWCGKPQTVCLTPEIIRALFYIADMPRTHDNWEIIKEAPEKAKLILEFIQGSNQGLLSYFGEEN
jgi:hypothetical protein